MMKLALIALLCVATASAAAVSRNNPFGIVENVADCGSTGILQFVAVTDCTMAPCDLVPGRTYDIQIVFIASRNAVQLTLNIVATLQSGVEMPIASVPVQGNIVGGEQFTVSFGFPITSQFSGQSLLIRFELIDEGDMRREVCATASAHIA